MVIAADEAARTEAGAWALVWGTPAPIEFKSNSADWLMVLERPYAGAGLHSHITVRDWEQVTQNGVR